MRRLVPGFIFVALSITGQDYPPPYPREGTTSLIDNARVLVWDVTWPKGVKGAVHRHLYAMTGIYYHPGDRIITGTDGAARPVKTEAGRIQWSLKGVTHSEKGTSDDSLRAVMIELKDDAPTGPAAPSDAAAPFEGEGKPLFANDRVTVWNYTRPTSTPMPHRHLFDTVVVWSDGRQGHAFFIPAGAIHNQEPIGRAAKATLFELK